MLAARTIRTTPFGQRLVIDPGNCVTIGSIVICVPRLVFVSTGLLPLAARRPGPIDGVVVGFCRLDRLLLDPLQA